MGYSFSHSALLIVGFKLLTSLGHLAIQISMFLSSHVTEWPGLENGLTYASLKHVITIPKTQYTHLYKPAKGIVLVSTANKSTNNMVKFWGLKVCLCNTGRAQPRILMQRGGGSKSLRIIGGSGGMLPQENFENLGVNILNFGEILL